MDFKRSFFNLMMQKTTAILVGIAITGQSITAAVGSVSVVANAVAVPIFGVSISTVLGVVSVTGSAAVAAVKSSIQSAINWMVSYFATGENFSAAVGSVTVSATAAVSAAGKSFTSFLGSVAVQTSAAVAIVGVSISSAVGTVATGMGDAIATVGTAFSSSVGSVAVSAGAVVSSVGSSLSAAVGAVTVTVAAVVTGLLTFNNKFSVGSSPEGVTFSPDGLYAYVPNYWSNTVSQFSVSGATWTPLSPATVAVGTNPQSVETFTDGLASYAYVTNYGSATISQFKIVSGALVPLSVPTIATGTNPVYFKMVNDGGFFGGFCTCYTDANGIWQFGFSTGGELSFVASYTTGTHAWGIETIGTGPLYVFVTSQNTAKIYQYYTSGGTLTPASTPTISTGAVPQIIKASHAGNFLYCACYNSNYVNQFSQSGGLLTALSAPTVAATGPAGIALSADGKFGYVVSQSSAVVNQFSITAGAMSPLSPATINAYTTASPPKGCTLYGSDAFLAVANEGEGKIYIFNKG